MEFKVKIDGLKQTISKLDDLAKRQVPFATAKALTTTAQNVIDEEIEQLKTTLDRPTPYILKGLFKKPATKTNLVATVWFKDKGSDWAFFSNATPAANIMQPQVEGGRRHLKRFESALRMIGVLPNGMYIAPGEACTLDAYGNIPRGLIVQILSYFRAFPDYKNNMTPERQAKIKKGTKKQRGYEYFASYGKGTWSGRQHLPAGIYKREGYAWGSRVRPILIFVKEPSYQKRFPFYEIAQKTVEKNLDANFSEALDYAIKTAK